ncbi:MAG: tRNA pseudouridine(38-40) synthase TruA [Acidobacteria bacterium]|nr:MAG: tRNA pseudouridine(38-40) synthase TruA [Acidobacteriota bacterium]RPJ84373.1 MAG: tRNA pseudouridine(38-40) synthase TruA [Acidobacteriota bacterium]
MSRFKLTVEYAGTRYSGWQIQKNARTVQGEIARAVREVTGRDDFELQGSGRTDAGVHALAQVAHLDLFTAARPEALLRQMNDALPPDIVVLAAERVPRRFHARHDAVARSYLYQVATRRTAFGKQFVWWVRDPLDVGRIREAAALFAGRHDFRSFSDAGGDGESTVVVVDRVEIAEEDALVLIRVEGSHFIWKMVRRIVGVLVEVGAGRLALEAVETFLSEVSPVPARVTAPASGLFLERVLYGADPPRPPLTGMVRIPWPAAPSPPRGGSSGPEYRRKPNRHPAGRTSARG